MEQPLLTFLVDGLLPGGAVGSTESIIKVLHNIQLLPGNWVRDFYEQLDLSDEGLSAFLTLGKYICFLELSKDKTEGSMSFFETIHDDAFMEGVSDRFRNNELRAQFINQYHLNKGHYYETLEEVVLALEPAALN